MHGLRTVVLMGCLLTASLVACAPPEVPEYRRRARGPVLLEPPPVPAPAANDELRAGLEEANQERAQQAGEAGADKGVQLKVALEDGRGTAETGGRRDATTRDLGGLAPVLPGGTTEPLAPRPAEPSPTPPPAISPATVAAPDAPVVFATDDDEFQARAVRQAGGPMQGIERMARGGRAEAAAVAAETENEPVLELGRQGQTSPEVLQVLRGQRNALQRCYDALVLRVPTTTEGNVTVRFSLSPAGEVQAANVVGGTLEDADFQQCVVGRLQTLTFPRADSAAVFTYPFRFGTGPALGGEGE